MGVVYEAEDMKLGRHVALKVLSGTADPAALERFWREARTASALNHPGICTLYEINESESQPFLVMELLEGESLDRLYSGKAVPLLRLLELGVQIADALDAAHRKGILHRDIKPANIFVTTTGQTKILDFGLARFEDRPSEETVAVGISARNMLTTPGSTLGTIAYMSPEQARGEVLDQRSDVFSLGVVLYEMSTGKHPFEGTTTAVVFDKLLNYMPPAPISVNQELPAEFESLLNKALEKDRDIRYQSAADLRADMRRLQRGTSASQMKSAAAIPAASAYPGMTRATVSAVSPTGSGATRPASTTAATSSLRSEVPQSATRPAGRGRRERTPQERERFRRILAVTALAVILVSIGRFALRVIAAHRKPAPTPAVAQASTPTPAATTTTTTAPPSTSPDTPDPTATPTPAVTEPAASAAASVADPPVHAAPAAAHSAVRHEPPKPAPAAPAQAAQPATPAPAAPASTAADVTPPPAPKPAAAAAPAAHSGFAAVSYPAHHVHAFPYLSGRSCDGTLQLTEGLLTFTSSVHPITFTRAQVSGIEGNGVVDSAGKKFRFQIDHMSNDQVHALLEKWYTAGAPAKPAAGAN